MQAQTFEYVDGDTTCIGYLAIPDSDTPKPCVLIVHDWSGCNQFAKQKAQELASMGYIGFAIDMYGNGALGETIEEKQALMNPLIEDRNLLATRVNSALQAISSQEEVDTNNIAAIGYCFGGLCALDLARSGAEVKGVVSFHGLLNKPDYETDIKAKVLVLHGYDDPMVSPEQVGQFADEMTKKNVDWQIHIYGHAKHAFANPNANNQDLGTVYNEKADKRSWHAATNFFEEIFS